MQNLLPPCTRLWPHITRYRLSPLSSRYLSHISFRSLSSPVNTRLQTYSSQGFHTNTRTAMGTPRAPFLSSIQQCLSPDSPWGFVIYRTTAYAPKETVIWEAFQRKFNSMIQETFDSAAGPEEEIATARRSWMVRWEEGSTMAEWALEDVKRYFSSLILFFYWTADAD